MRRVQVWAPSGWKRPANIRLCATALRSLGLDGSDAERALNAYPGHWEAGSAPPSHLTAFLFCVPAISGDCRFVSRPLPGWALRAAT